MHFVPFPAVDEQQRLALTTTIDLNRVQLSPAEALAFAPRADGLRLVGIEGRPVYILQLQDGATAALGADTGERLGSLSAEQAGRIAAAYARSTAASVTGPLSHDQWTVMGELNSFRPLYRVALRDSANTEVYVSARTGEIAQTTTAMQRRWNWCGAILHWIYFTALRAHPVAWDRVVWWVALVGLSSTVAGLWLGWLRFSAGRRGGKRRLTPFRGWLGWHHRIGLFLGVFVLTWIFSGWLSMDHGRLFPTGEPSHSEIERLQGLPLSEIARAASLAIVRDAGPAAELLFGAVAGRPFVVARGSGAERVTFAKAPENVLGSIPVTDLIAGVRAAWPAGTVIDGGTVSRGNLYSVAEYMPGGVRRMHVGSPSDVDVYIEQGSAHIVMVMGSGRRAYEWLYYAMHTLKFPGLITHPLLRDVAVLGLMASGFLFSLTGAVIAISRLRMTFRHRAG